MNMQEIKAQIASSLKVSFGTVMFNRVFEDKERTVSTPWVASWNELKDTEGNTKRIRISIHDDLWNDLKATPSLNTLYVKDNGVVQKSEDKQPHHAYIVCRSKHTEGAF